MPNQPAIPLRGVTPEGAKLNKTLPPHEHIARRTRSKTGKLPAIPRKPAAK